MWSEIWHRQSSAPRFFISGRSKTVILEIFDERKEGKRDIDGVRQNVVQKQKQIRVCPVLHLLHIQQPFTTILIT